MTTDDADDQVQEVTVAPRPMPWGQLIVGAVIGGVATWMILLIQSGVAPSSMLAGVAATYEGARDFVLNPVAKALGVQLSPDYRDALALLAVLFAAIVRVMDPTARALNDLTAPPAMLILWNAVSIAALAGALFFISWATA